MNIHKNVFFAAITTGTMVLGVLGMSAVQAATLRIACGSGPHLEHCTKTVQAWGKQHGHKVETVSTPNSPTEQLALYQQMLAAKSPDIDIYQIDVVWAGTLAPHLVDLKPHAKGAEEDHFPAIIKNNMVDGKLIASGINAPAGAVVASNISLFILNAAVPWSGDVYGTILVVGRGVTALDVANLYNQDAQGFSFCTWRQGDSTEQYGVPPQTGSFVGNVKDTGDVLPFAQLVLALGSGRPQSIDRPPQLRRKRD